MKSKAKPNSENDPCARPLPVEEFALLVEGLSEADIEAICAQDGASPDGVPLDWSGEAFSERLAERLGSSGPKSPESESEWDAWREKPSGSLSEQSSCVIIARGRELSPLGVADGEALDVHVDMSPREGDLVIAELAGFGKLLRKLRFVGGVPLLCSEHVDRPAIPLSRQDLARLRVVARRALRD